MTKLTCNAHATCLSQGKRATKTRNLLQNELKVYVARFTNHESNLPCNKTGCCSLRKVVAGSREWV